VTVEFAVLMPAMVMLLAVVLAAGSASLAYVRCLDAARSAARLAARHEQPEVVREAVRSLAPEGAQVTMAASGGHVRITVSADISLPLPWHPRLAVTETAAALVEGQ
jgi:Flp pilus assembly protein TadG